ncbi:unnamed protein product [Vitrella brassicaformis CCMP3155]|uniref:50S ribosomal protein L19, chloroplastic n=2 Tax=Vitrella brassicaformis TaxID=1169539 RepID=A0A0G4ECT9_VITBC|nr:unnamed protein product [Vitrella brassicaformis CCMP3155]|eukprot:CEL93131.1 unnamed protein product [Vitrella brassicaformis CCMP3155]
MNARQLWSALRDGPLGRPTSAHCTALEARARAGIKVTYRGLRQRLHQSTAPFKKYTVDNPITAGTWPPLDQMGTPITNRECFQLMHHLQMAEVARLRRLRTFSMPRINPGDLVEVRYELSRTQQTFAVFQGYCVEVRLKRSDSSFTLKNVYEGVGVEQLVPRYSPRLLDVRVLKAIPNPQTAQKEPLTRDYRYKWQYNVRGKFTMKQGVHKPGIRSVEPKIRRRLSNIKRRYMHQRVEAGQLIKAEMYRRALIYSLDEQRRRAHRLRRRRQKQKWGVYMIDKEPKITAITALPSYHPLTEGNLPK